MRQFVGMNSHPKHMLQQVLADDDRFLMGRVLVGVSMSLAPQSHADSVHAKQQLDAAVDILQTCEHSLRKLG